MSEGEGRSIFQRLARFGFPIFFVGAFLIAIGIRQEIQEVWVTGVVVVGAVFLIAMARAVRGAWGRPRRPPSAESTANRPTPSATPRPAPPGVTRADDV